MKDTYYAYGKYFDNQAEFLKFCNEWPDLPFDLDEFKRNMNDRIHEAEMNHHIHKGTLTNREAYQILRMSTDWAADKVTIENFPTHPKL